MNRKLRIVPAAVTLVTLAAVTTAFALSGKPKTETSSPRAAMTPAAAPAPAVTTSAPAISARQNKSDDDGEKDDDHEGKDDDEKDGEDKDDKPLTATITPAAATAAAIAAQPGTAGEVELEDENGTTVYDADVTAADGKKYDVKVDANTGKILKSEADDENEGPDGNDEEKDDAK